MSVPMLRAFFIHNILDERFSLSALQEWKTNDPEWWDSDRNERGRGFYREAMRERERLLASTTDELEAEVAAVALWWKQVSARAVANGPVDRDEDYMPMAPMPGLPSS